MKHRLDLGRAQFYRSQPRSVRIARAARNILNPGPEARCRHNHETQMNAPVLPPRPRRPITVYVRDDVLDQLDLLVTLLPDAPNRSRLIESFLEMQIGLLLNPTEALPLVLEGVLNTITQEAMAEIDAWRVPGLDPETEAAGNA